VAGPQPALFSQAILVRIAPAGNRPTAAKYNSRRELGQLAVMQMLVIALYAANINFL
jgi:hypothetical protein